MKRVLLWFLVICSLLALLLTALGFELKRRWEQPLAISEEGLLFELKQGDSLNSVAHRLVDQGLLDQPYMLTLYGRLTGLDSRLQRGEYLLPHGLKQAELLELLLSGNVVQYQVTIPEGLTLRQALELLARQESLERSLDGLEDGRIAALTKNYPSPEGLFLPETYRYVRGDSDWNILQRAFAAMQRLLAEEWQDRDDELPLASPYEALVLASIIERETGVASERGEIAGVFVRRLNKGMRLQTDPTVIYGLGSEFDGNLRRSHLRDEENPYNTYRHHGLPPSPIALPGAAAIHAALHPKDGDTLFFVARGDGSHVFSATLDAHQRAVRKYQLRRRADYRSTPQPEVK
ncbi:endolytic transglycosylase MltG [Parahaliea sp. F7430]|uniref:Endolytic murein transglycosylase n=1 Tax=Sediminihaliea albiluteola TaxID=2758564 RepID=A0A7W2TUF4_9GAMM|nr:endolytic transglycosylase MltG [Sediminihaliea albiluteola]MBA6412182.1 endolytic transglycosylase MltG [Sediminihaliea albiluteola]